MIRLFLCGLLLAGGPAGFAQTSAAQKPAAAAEPSNDEQDRLLAQMHEYADKYASNLPNFICDQVTRESQADVGTTRWKKGDTAVAKLSFHDGHEDRTTVLVNGRKVKAGHTSRVLPLTTEGEFGGLLTQVLGKESQAYFKWSQWDTVRGKRLAVFSFSVDQPQSTMSLHLSDAVGAYVGYEGSLYADPQTGAVWRIAYTAKDIPKVIQARQISTTVDYGETTIGAKTYLLPVQATVNLVLWVKQIRNEMQFQAYRKFEADSTIRFDTGEAPK